MKNVTRKLLGLILTFCIAMTLMPIGASAASSYNASKALEYAKAHWNDGVELCAGFVSNCLKAGGLTSWNRECSNLYDQLVKEVVNGAKIASVQYLTTSGNYIKTADNKGKVSKGDVLFWLCSGCPYDSVGGPYQHAALVSDVSSTYVKVYQHNNAMNNEAAWVGNCYECGRRYSHMVVIHFNTSTSTSSTLKVSEYFSCDVQINTTKGKTVNLFSSPTDSSRKSYFDQGQTAYSTRAAKLSNGSTWYEISAIDNGKTVKLWLNASSSGVTIKNRSTTVSDGIYVIQAGIGNNMVLDVESGSQNAGARLLLWERHNGDNQKVRIVNLGNGYVALQLVHSGKVLDVEGASRQSGAKVIQWDWNSGLNQQWKLTSVGNGYYTITSALSGMALDVSGGVANPGSEMIVYTPHGGANQMFKLSAVK